MFMCFVDHSRMKANSIFLKHLLLNVLLLLGIASITFAASPSPQSHPLALLGSSPEGLGSPEDSLPSVEVSPASSKVLDEEQKTNASSESNSEAAASPTPLDEGGLTTPQPGSPTAADPNALIPSGGGPASTPKLTETQQKEMNAKELAKYKAVKVEAEKDPAIRRMAQRAQRTSTEEDYRAAMREYYRMLFNKIELLDPSLTGKARGMKEAYLRRLVQSRIEPTIPLHPPPTPEPLTP